MLNQTRYFTTARKELNSILDFITDALASSGLDPKACGRTSSVWFLKQFGQVMMAAFVLASSNAVMPLSMQTCRDKLGISPKIYSFTKDYEKSGHPNG